MSNLITQKFLEDSQEWFDSLTGNEQQEVVAEKTIHYFEKDTNMNNEDIFSWFDKLPSYEQNDIILNAYITAKKIQVE